MTRLSTAKEKLYDGTDEGYYTFSHQFQVPEEMVIYERDFRKNYFDSLEALMSATDFNQLMREGSFKKPVGPFGDYKGTDGLGLNYLLNGSILYVFASGEYQPARYKIYFEGAWDSKPSTR